MTGNPTQDIVNYHLEEFRKKEFPGLTTGDAFTQYCARLVLKDYNIAQSDYGSGVVDGKYDGGLDGFFIIINKTLALTKDSRGVGGTKAPVAWQQGLPFDVVIFQSKSGPSWDHTALWKLEETVKQFLDSKESLTTLFKTPLNQSVINQIDTFRRIEKKLVPLNPVRSFNIVFMSNAPEGAVNKHIKNTRSSLEKTLKEKLPYGTKIAVRLVGAEGLYDMIMQEPDFDGLMRFTRSPIREDKRNSQAFLGLVTIKQYVEFLRRKGTKILRDEFFSANVRAYGGDTRAVNAAIKGTLSSNTQSAFWWMNNGITILADEATEPKNDTWRLKNPQIVNGLQTSHVLHETELQGAITAQRLRETILVRIITEKDPDIREAIITGTNNQTNVSSTQLYANDEVQLRLEKYLKTKGWYYERRRWQYRNTGTPSSKIKNITELAQLMMSIHLLSPDFARARPGNILKSREGYKKIFPEGVSEELYVKALNIGEAVETYLRSDSAVEISFDPLNDRFYIVSGYILRHMGIKTLEDYDAFRFVRQVNDKPTNEQLEEVHNLLYGVVGRFSSADAKDKIFKGSELKNRFFEKILDENVR